MSGKMFYQLINHGYFYMILSNFYSFIPFLYNLKFSSEHAIFFKKFKALFQKNPHEIFQEM